MEVVNLHETGEMPSDYKFYRCIVTDNIIPMAKAKNYGKKVEPFTIHVVFRKDDLQLTESFQLIFCDPSKDVTKLSASYVANNAFAMWNVPSEQNSESPVTHRYKDDAIKLDFFYDKKAGSISYTWTDYYPSDGIHKPVRVRAINRYKANCKMGLYLILPFAGSVAWVLSDKAYGSYLRQKVPLTRTAIYCVICFGVELNVSYIMYKCKHVLCAVCHNKLKHNNPSVLEFCVGCKVASRADEITRIKVRNGSCPIDQCKHRNADTNGVVIIPCGCFVLCSQLEKAVQQNGNDLLPLIPYCPYDACRLRIHNFIIPFVEIVEDF
uniref:RING-type domain-containing protein n=1 Tax=Caenorhabditis japonica TaxID=281687 RepID=A0A8R1DJD0_CAEJA